MNQVYCPECNTELTKSIVGYLCHGCGNVHGFEKVSSAAFEHSSGVPANPAPTPATSSFAREQDHMHAPKANPNKLAHKVKKVVVPEIAELPKPVDEEHLLSAQLAESVAPSETPPAFVPKAASSAMKEEFSTETAGRALAYPEEMQAVTSTTHMQSYLLPALAGVLVVIALALGYLFIR